jgi:hypothetical protein
MKLSIFTLSLTIAVFVQSAYAQQTTGTRIGPERGRIFEGGTKVGDARRTIDDYARCLVGALPKKVEKFLEQPAGHPDFLKKANDLATDECFLAGELKFNSIQLKPVLFDRYYRVKFKKLAFKNFDDVKRINVITDISSKLAVQHSALMRFSNCVVAADPLAAHDLILTQVETAQEATAFSQVVPNLSPCLDKDQKVSLSKSAVRGFIAESLYLASVAAENMIKGAGQ